MKKITQLLSALVFCSLMIFISCNKGNDDEPEVVDPRDAQAEKLEGTWNVTSAEFEKAPREDWKSASIKFTYNYDTDAGTYTVSGVPEEQDGDDEAKVLGGSSGTWSFKSETETGVIVRGDGVEMTIDNLSDSALGLTFTITDATARVAGFNGEWEFDFSAQ